MTPMRAAIQDVWGNAAQALKLCIEQAKETAESAKRALQVIDREQSR